MVASHRPHRQTNSGESDDAACRDRSALPDSSPYDAAARFLAGRIDYERALSMPNAEEAFKLDRMRELLRRIGDPQRSLPIVHIAGTKGKGSTAAMISAVLAAAGYRAGLFSSPHIERVEERMAVDGRPCARGELVESIDLIRPAVEAMDREGADRRPPAPGPTYFEVLTAAALKHFELRGVDIAVLEVGLGGRLDSTNVCEPLLSIVTSISLDHTRQLGVALESIAAEKAGIVKPGATVVSGVRAEGPRDVIRRAAASAGCRLVELGVDFDFDYRPPRLLDRAASPPTLDFRFSRGKATGDDMSGNDVKNIEYAGVELALLGRHQAANAAVAMAAIEELRRAGWVVAEEAIRRGLAKVVWPARIEVISRHPTVIVDAAHNVASIEALVETLDDSFSADRRLLVFATTSDKDIEGMLRVLLSRFDRVIFTRYSDNPRGVPAEELLRLSARLAPNTPSETAPTPAEALSAAARLAHPDDLICITGSFFLAAELRRLLRPE